MDNFRVITETAQDTADMTAVCNELYIIFTEHGKSGNGGGEQSDG